MGYIKAIAKRAVKKWYIAAAIVLVMLCIALVYGTCIADTVFESETAISISEIKAPADAIKPDTTKAINLETVISEYLVLAKTESVFDAVIKKAGVDEDLYITKYLKDNLIVERVGKSFVMKVKIKAYSKSDAGKILEAFNTAGVDELKTMQGANVFVQVTDNPSVAVQTQPNLFKLSILAIVAGLFVAGCVIVVPLFPAFRVFRKQDIETNFETIVLEVVEEDK